MYERVVGTCQDTHNPEIAHLFYDGSQSTFKKAVEERIDKLIQDFFIEYLREDLSTRDPQKKYDA